MIIVTFEPKHIAINLVFFTSIKYFSRCIIYDSTFRAVLKYTKQEFNILSTICFFKYKYNFLSLFTKQVCIQIFIRKVII